MAEACAAPTAVEAAAVDAEVPSADGGDTSVAAITTSHDARGPPLTNVFSPRRRRGPSPLPLAPCSEVVMA